jgi:hypothetical protein
VLRFLEARLAVLQTNVYGMQSSDGAVPEIFSKCVPLDPEVVDLVDY